ncbi:DUF4360 domain-containing protein [Streptomyces sp. MS2.AVA.5]|uniref:DUF4360 domain-containing protein n=2 Tax=Streptomyces achmelvichensis TaxID=3134111 RepID=A0ACC6Q856_9ACTN
MFRSLAAGAVVAALFAAVSPAHGAPVPDVPPGKVVIDLETVNGSGCRKGTAAVAVASDNTAFTVTYSEYMASSGAGAQPTDFRKNCQLNLNVHVPSGFTYAIASADYRGYGYLQRGAVGQQRANYYFQGQPQTTRKTHQFNGPWNDSWQARDVTEIAQLVWAPCGEQRNFNINTELRVSAGSSSPQSTNFMTMDSTDASVSTEYQLAWRKCS